MSQIRPVFVPPAGDTARESGQVILRDGTTASIRSARPDDLPALRRFVTRLAPAARHEPFFATTPASDDQLRRLCGRTPPHGEALLALQSSDHTPHVIGVSSYRASDEETAEVALAVDDSLAGKGLTALLLERIALHAARAGFARLSAAAPVEHAAMREVFRESGFEVRESLDGGNARLTVSLIATPATVARSEGRERIAAAASLRPFFHPRAVAVIGASRNPASVGGRLVQALVQAGFRRPIYPVNPHADEIQGLRTFPSMAQLPGPADLAIVAVPRDLVLSVAHDCAAAGVRALVVITAGFAEVGEEGRRRQADLVRLVREAGMRMIGPNCFGLVNADPTVRLNATFATTFPPPGRIAMSSQSGALGLAILRGAGRLHLGISTFVSVGNKADVSGNDLLQYWEEDPATSVILLYLESFGNPRRFARIARRVAMQKPIVAVKAGRSQAGRRAAGSHTAALAASDVAVDALFHQTGVIRAETLDEMFSLATLLAHQPLPRGRRVAIVTNAGGPGILAADACEAAGLTAPPFSQPLMARLRQFLPAAAAVSNPVDLIASATAAHYQDAVTAVMAAGEVDLVILLYISVNPTDTASIADGILTGVRTARQHGSPIPVLLCWMAEGDAERTFAVDGEVIPSYRMPELPARAAGKAAAYAEWRRRGPDALLEFHDLDLAAAQTVCERAVTLRGAGWLTTEETMTLLSAIRLPLSPWRVTRTAEEALEAARSFGYPVALKLASHRVVHKTEVGGVQLHLADEAAVRTAYETIVNAARAVHGPDALDGVLVQPMMRGGVEVMIGMMLDPQFGPLLAFGLGGIHVEILKDVAFRIAPLSARDAREMIRETRGYRLLEGYRGHRPADVSALEDVLLRISRLVEDIHAIAELDLNPIFAMTPGEGCRIVDARIRVASP